MAAKMVTIVLLTRKRVAVMCVGVGIQSYRDKNARKPSFNLKVKKMSVLLATRWKGSHLILLKHGERRGVCVCTLA